MEVTSFMAVVCSGIASLKWRTSSTRPNEVQPCEPCITGMQPSSPRKARVAPSGWLILSGLTVQAFLDSTTLAMVDGSRWVWGSARHFFGLQAHRLGGDIRQKAHGLRDR